MDRLFKISPHDYLAGTSRTVETGETYFNAILKSREARHRIAQRKIILRIPISEMELKAYINHARFLVDCPFCSNTEFAWEDGLFFCSSCKNKQIEGKVIKVILPENRMKIEDLLSRRNIPNRNWINETELKLQEENLASKGILIGGV